jgi:hypothetical protein
MAEGVRQIGLQEGIGYRFSGHSREKRKQRTKILLLSPSGKWSKVEKAGARQVEKMQFRLSIPIPGDKDIPYVGREHKKTHLVHAPEASPQILQYRLDGVICRPIR